MKNTFIVLFLLLLSCVSFGVQYQWPPGGGSNYVTASIGEYARNATFPVWFTPWTLRPIIGTYNMEPSLIQSQMQTMKARGQDSITLVLWHAPLASNEGLDNVYGHIVNSSGGVLVPQHGQNLVNVLKLISNVGFKKLFFRFATQLTAHPFYWNSWNEAQYQENLAFLKMVREIIYQNFPTNVIPVMFDLCLETGGIGIGQATAYTTRLWGDYTKEFGALDTYGFTIAFFPNVSRVTDAMAVFDAVGVRPPMYAFDFYGHEYTVLSQVYSSLVSFNEGAKPILIQECFLNDVFVYEAFMNATKQFNIPLVGIFQWPLASTSNHRAFSVDYAPDYTAYLDGVAGFLQAYPNPCNSTGGSCVANITWQSNNAESPCLFLYYENNPPKLVTCSQSGSIAPSIPTSSYYYYELHQTYDINSLLLASANVTTEVGNSWSTLE